MLRTTDVSSSVVTSLVANLQLGLQNIEPLLRLGLGGDVRLGVFGNVVRWKMGEATAQPQASLRRLLIQKYRLLYLLERGKRDE